MQYSTNCIFIQRRQLLVKHRERFFFLHRVTAAASLLHGCWTRREVATRRWDCDQRVGDLSAIESTHRFRGLRRAVPIPLLPLAFKIEQVSLGQRRTQRENPFSVRHASVPEEEKFARGLRPGDIRLSLGLEVWHDLLADREDALEVVWPGGQVAYDVQFVAPCG